MRKQTKIAAMVSAAALLAIGASMTSFAAGWTQEDGQWVYLDRDGVKVEEEWKPSGGNYYWLDEDGYMATNQLVKDDRSNGVTEIYYVGEDGRRVTNQWVSVDNIEDESVGPDSREVDTLWYYFGPTGKAYKSTKDDGMPVSRTVAWSGGTNKFLFDTEGHMMSGWYVEYDDEGKIAAIYYLGDENEGYAHTGWQYLEPAEEEYGMESGDIDHPYESQEWFYFQSSGKAHVGTTKYIGGKYFTFDGWGVLDDEWLPVDTSTSATASDPGRYNNVDGGKNGWVYSASKEDPDSYYWYYLVTTGGGTKTAAFGSNSYWWGREGIDPSNGKTVDDMATKTYIAKSIGGKVYLFNAYGEMQSGLIKIKKYNTDQPQYNNEDNNRLMTDSSWNGVAAKPLYVGRTYYFSTAAASQGKDGHMLKGKVTHEDNGETFYYYFDKAEGYALTSTIKDNILYGPDGKRIQAEDGASKALVRMSDKFGDKDGNITSYISVAGKGKVLKSGTLIVSSTGKVTEKGVVTIDDLKYEVEDYRVVRCYEKQKVNGNLVYHTGDQFFEAVTE